MKKGDKVVYIGNMAWTKQLCLANDVPVPDPKKNYTVLSSDEQTIELVGLPSNNKGWWKTFWRKVEDDTFTNALTRELAHKTIWTEETYHPEIQRRESNPKIFTTKAKF